MMRNKILTFHNPKKQIELSLLSILLRIHCLQRKRARFQTSRVRAWSKMQTKMQTNKQNLVSNNFQKIE